MLNAALICTLICSASLASFASGQSFSSKAGKFDSKHFSVEHKNQARLTIDMSRAMAQLKITESACLQSDNCQDLETTRLNQIYEISQTTVDACNVKVWKGQFKPAVRAVSRLNRNQLMMSEIEIRDARLSTCGSQSQNAQIQVTLNTRTKTSVGTSTIQFQNSTQEIARN
jgi:hypothetical protein